MLGFMIWTILAFQSGYFPVERIFFGNRQKCQHPDNIGDCAQNCGNYDHCLDCCNEFEDQTDYRNCKERCDDKFPE